MKVSAPSGETGFLDSLIDSLADPIFVKDRKHRWVLFNEAFVALGKRFEAALAALASAS